MRRRSRGENPKAPFIRGQLAKQCHQSLGDLGWKDGVRFAPDRRDDTS